MPPTYQINPSHFPIRCSYNGIVETDDEYCLRIDAAFRLKTNALNTSIQIKSFAEQLIETFWYSISPTQQFMFGELWRYLRDDSLEKAHAVESRQNYLLGHEMLARAALPRPCQPA